MKRMILVLLFSIFATGLLAETLIEEFPDPLGDWRDRWLALNTNMQNYYVAWGDPDEDNRGNNPCGLWIHDGDTDQTDCTIVFEPSFGATVSYFEIAVEAFVDLTLYVYDLEGVEVGSVFIAENYAGGDYGCGCVPFGFNTPNGLGSFLMTGDYVEGNTAIDDVTVIVDTTASEESTWSSIKALY